MVLMTVLVVFISITNSAPPIIVDKEPDDLPSIASDGNPLFSDDFGDSSINSTWTVVPNLGTVTEPAGGYLQLYYGSSPQRCDWWGGAEPCYAPHAFVNMPVEDFNVTTRNLNTAGMPAYAHAGIIFYLNQENVVFFGSLRDTGLGDGIALEGISADVGWRESKAGNYLDQYLRVRKVSDTYYFESSSDGNTWTELDNCTNALWNFIPSKIGLFMKDWGSYTPYGAQFDYFNVTGAHWSDIILFDDFNDQSINLVWNQVPKSGSITEPVGGYLDLYYGSFAQRCDWWGGAEICRAPHVYTDMPAEDFIMTTRNLNALGMPAYSQAGFILYLDEENVVFFGNLRDTGLGDGIAFEGISADVGWYDAKAGSYLDEYLRVRKLSDTYYFEYSADGNSWTLLKNCTNAFWSFTPTKVGLFMKDWGSFTPYGTQFDFFNLSRVPSNHVPVIFGPESYSFEFNSTNNNITWNVIDPDTNNANYTIYKNESVWGTSGLEWHSGDKIVQNLDGLTPNDYNITLLVYDGFGANATWTVLVNAYNVVPLISGVDTMNYEYGTNGHTISWNITDPSTLNANYTVYKNESIWGTAGETWTSGDNVTISVDGLSAGDYNITIIAFDGYNASTSKTTILTVYNISTNGTWQPIVLGIQLIECRVSPTTHVKLFVTGRLSGTNIKITSQLSNPVNVGLEGGIAFFSIVLENVNSVEYPVKAKFYYDASLLGEGIAENNLGVYHLENGAWVFLGGQVETTENYIIVNCQGFSVYAIAPIPTQPFDWGLVGIIGAIAAIVVAIMLFFKFRGGKGKKFEGTGELEFDLFD